MSARDRFEIFHVGPAERHSMLQTGPARSVRIPPPMAAMGHRATFRQPAGMYALSLRPHAKRLMSARLVHVLLESALFLEVADKGDGLVGRTRAELRDDIDQRPFDVFRHAFGIA